MEYGSCLFLGTNSANQLVAEQPRPLDDTKENISTKVDQTAG